MDDNAKIHEQVFVASDVINFLPKQHPLDVACCDFEEAFIEDNVPGLNRIDARAAANTDPPRLSRPKGTLWSL